MVKIRKFCAYRRLDRPYTRVSKFRKKAFIRITPNPRIVRFEMGNLQADFPYRVELKVKKEIQMRDNALEAARTTCNKILEAKLGKAFYKYKIRVYPFHILRENPLAAGAGADRMSTGMKHAFGKPIGLAAQIRTDQTIYEVGVDKKNIPIAKEALKAASRKLTGSFNIVVLDREEIKKNKLAKETGRSAPVTKKKAPAVKNDAVARKPQEAVVEKQAEEVVVKAERSEEQLVAA